MQVLCICCRFRPPQVKDVIHQVLKESLHEKQYSSEDARTLSKEISDSIQSRLKGVAVIPCNMHIQHVLVCVL